MTDGKRKPMHKLPPVVRREYQRAVQPFEHLTPEEIEHRLAAHQLAKIAAIQQGVTMALSKPDQAMEPDYHDLERLAMARQAVRTASTIEGAADYISATVAQAFGGQGGAPKTHDEQAIKEAVRAVLTERCADKPLKKTQIVGRVQALMQEQHKPIPGKTKIHEVLSMVLKEDGEKIR